MKKHRVFFFAGLLITSLAFAFTLSRRPLKNVKAGTGFALIELYTSEGCSSCPAADKLLAKVAQVYKDKEVYVLAYHVDYWNHLGWKDTFSSAQFSQRQRTYSGYLKLDGVYTPQAIVNGRTEFVGSDESRMTNAINQSLSKSTTEDLTLTHIKINGNKVTLQYQVSGGTQSNNNLELAVVQKQAQTQVKAGENGGHILSHINVVQKLQSISLKSDAGHAEISLPDGFNPKDYSIIAFVQSSRHGEILAVQKAIIAGKEIAAIN